MNLDKWGFPEKGSRIIILTEQEIDWLDRELQWIEEESLSLQSKLLAKIIRDKLYANNS